MRLVSASPGRCRRASSPPRIQLLELDEQPPQVLGLDAGARVVHLDAEELGPSGEARMVTSPPAGVNLSALERYLEHLLEPGRVEHHAPDGRVHRNLDADLLSARWSSRSRPPSPMACARSIDSGRKSSFPD